MSDASANVQIKRLAARPRGCERSKFESCLRRLLIALIEADQAFAETFYFWHFLLHIESEALFS
jgi:hypothetical protein